MANKSSNASATEFGFDFQHNAGIVLMLKFIKSVESVRCEGNFEDVELTLVSKKKIYAQAKALVNPDMHKSIVSKMWLKSARPQRYSATIQVRQAEARQN